MKRVEANAEWSLFCPNEAPGLHDVHSAEFEALYEKYEKEGRARRSIPAQKLWYAILEAQIETGGPFMVYKDSANCKSFCFICLTQVLTFSLQANLTNRTSGLSSPPTSALRSSNTPLPTRPLYAISPRLPSPLLCPAVNTTSKNSTTSPRSLHST